MSDRAAFSVAATALIAVLAVVSGSASGVAIRACSVHGLRFERHVASATYSVVVRALRRRERTCRRAREIAGVAARADLRGAAVPHRIRGFVVTLARPCGGCAPRTLVTARRASARVAFRLGGGA